MKIYVMAHKKFNTQLPDIYVPLQVGAEINDDIGYQKDNSGENISAKNKNYCELTGLYWIWKNSSDDIAGICHYRRYFTKSGQILTETDIRELMADCDILIPQSLFGVANSSSVFSHYCQRHYGNDLIECGKVIHKLFPEYSNAFELGIQCNLLSPANMMITKKEILGCYCAWLFPVLFELERRINISGYNDYQKRIFGFLSERLLRIWLLNQSYNVKEVEISIIE